MSAKAKLKGGGGSGEAASAHQVVNPFSLGAPVALGLGMVMAGLLVRRYLAHDRYAILWGIMLLACLAGLVAGVWRVMDARDPSGKDKRAQLAKWVALVGTGGGSVWILVLAELPKPLGWRPFIAFLMPWIVITVVQWFLSVGHADAQAAAAAGWESPTDKLKGPVGAISNINRIRTQDDRVIAEVTMKEGETIADLQKAGAQVASVLDVRAGAVKIFEGDANSSVRRGRIEIQPLDPFATPQPWPGPFGAAGPQHPSELAHLSEAQVEGLMLDLGHELIYGPGGSGFWLIGDEARGRNASMIQMVGMNGAGKSVFLQLLCVSILARGNEARYVYCDGRKAQQQPKWLRDGADAVYATNRGIIKFLQEVRREWVPARTAWLGARGLSQWIPGCGLAHVTIMIDEALSFGQDAARLLADLAETLRSLGVVLVVGLQQARGTRWPTEVRSQFGTSITFGVKGAIDAEMALTELQAEAGCSPHLWENNHAGKHYLSAPGMSDDDRIRERRTYKPAKDLLEVWATWLLARRSRTVDPLGAEAAPHATMASGGAFMPAFRDAGQAVELDVEEGVLVDEDEEDGEDYEEASGRVDEIDFDAMDEEELRMAADEALREAVEDAEDPEDDSYHEDLDEELQRRGLSPEDAAEAAAGAGPSVPLRGDFQMRPPAKMSEHAARTFLASWLEAERRKGRAEVRAHELVDVLEATGMKSGWLKKWLDRFATDPEFAHLGLSKVGPRLGYELAPLPRALAGT